MRRIRARVRVEFEACDLPETGAVGRPSKVADGCFEVDFDASRALDIDTMEQALLEASAPALRDALSSRLAQETREQALSDAGPGVRVVALSTPYPVDGEVGRFQIPCYDILAGEVLIRTRDLFPTLRGKERYLTKCFRPVRKAGCRSAARSRPISSTMLAHTLGPTVTGSAWAGRSDGRLPQSNGCRAFSVSYLG